MGHCSEDLDSVPLSAVFVNSSRFCRRYGPTRGAPLSREMRARNWRACCLKSRISCRSSSSGRFAARSGPAPIIQLLLRLRSPTHFSTTNADGSQDLHWADDSTLSLLDHLTQRLFNMPLMVVGTYRDADLDVTHGLAKTLEALLRRRLASRMNSKACQSMQWERCSRV